MAFYPYLFFAGTCRQAFTRYQEIFGGDLRLLPMSDAPDSDDVPADQRDLIMHAALAIGDQLLMASDDPNPDAGPVQGMFVNYSVSDVGEAERVFAALAEGGEVRQAMAETFWAPRFGMCVDRFGIPWMVNAEPPEPAG